MGPGFGEGLGKGMLYMAGFILVAGLLLGAGCVSCVGYVRRNVSVSVSFSDGGAP